MWSSDKTKLTGIYSLSSFPLSLSVSLSLCLSLSSGAPLYASITPNNPIDPPELIDPNFDCFTNTRTCHPSTLVEHYIYSQMAGMQGNTNELAALELALQNVTTTALSNAASFIRNVNGTKELNPNSGDQTANMANFQNFVLPAQKAVQRTKVRRKAFVSLFWIRTDDNRYLSFPRLSSHSALFEQVAFDHRDLWRLYYSCHCLLITSSSSRRYAFRQRNRTHPHHQVSRLEEAVF